MGFMKQFGLRFYILFNIIIICAVGVTLLGVISLKITEQFAIKGRIDGTRAIIEAFESTYGKFADTQERLEYLERALEPGAWGVLTDGSGRHIFTTPGAVIDETLIDQADLNMAANSGQGELSVMGSSFLPFTSYRGFSITVPVRTGTGTSAVFVFRPLDSFAGTISTSQKLIAAWILLFILILAIFGYYLLSTTVIRPFQKLIGVTRGISRGEFREDVNVGNISEINQLYNALSNMHQEIEENKNELQKNIENLESANRTILHTQKQLIASEKLASLGRLSAGVAHEIGNPLSAINGYVEVLKRKDYITEEQSRQYLENISSEIERINTIIKTLLDYSRPKETSIQYNDINEIVLETRKILLDQGILKDIDVDIDLDNYPIYVKVDKYQMIQVFINLILNSRDALNGKGNIEIKTGVDQDNRAEILISDNGQGIPVDYLDRIFDPFFTTKEPGTGTGLGLSVTQRIIEQYNGRISVASSSQKGTTFSILFDEYYRDSNAEDTTC